ncbi:MAG: stage II sporulation protein M [Candidatus Aenigmatarchaeota archaeon]|nr:stage II sporulation protein M [Candidatus Aenigmarchaeota archaeon]
MVLEKIITIREAIRHPLWMFVIGAIVSVISLFISFLIFSESVGLFTSVLVTFIMTPFMVNLLTYEAFMTEVEIKRRIKSNFFQRHADMLLIYTAFFSGMVVALSLTFIFLPDPTVEKLFADQITEIKLIRGSFLISSTFLKIATNNIGVLVLATLFAFIFGSGAIFILSWNASVLSTAIGLTAKSIGGLSGIPVALITYLPHGVFEIMAYFLAGIAGGILSAVTMRRKTELFGVMVLDSVKVLALAILLLLVGAWIETLMISA